MASVLQISAASRRILPSYKARWSRSSMREGAFPQSWIKPKKRRRICSRRIWGSTTGSPTWRTRPRSYRRDWSRWRGGRRRGECRVCCRCGTLSPGPSAPPTSSRSSPSWTATPAEWAAAATVRPATARTTWGNTRGTAGRRSSSPGETSRCEPHVVTLSVQAADRIWVKYQEKKVNRVGSLVC